MGTFTLASGQILCGVKSSIMGCVPIFLQLYGLKSLRNNSHPINVNGPFAVYQFYILSLRELAQLPLLLSTASNAQCFKVQGNFLRPINKEWQLIYKGLKNCPGF